MEAFTQQIIKSIKSIPKGKVATYGSIAVMAGNPRGARQVARIIHSMSRSHQLPWHRVINARGTISLPRERGYVAQKSLLQSEGIAFDDNDRVALDKYLWLG